MSPWLGVLWSSPAQLMVPLPSPLALGTWCRAVPVVKPGCKTLGLSVWKQKWGIQPSPFPLLLHHVSLEKSGFKLLPWLVLPRQSSASCICLSCHISVCCEPRHDIPSRLAYHGNKVALCENGKVVAFQKTGWRTSAANGKEKKKACLSG